MKESKRGLLIPPDQIEKLENFLDQARKSRCFGLNDLVHFANTGEHPKLGPNEEVGLAILLLECGITLSTE